MFCHQCGSNVSGETIFCPQCGTKLIEDSIMAKLTVSCIKLKGYLPGTVFPLLIDGVQEGEVPNGGTLTINVNHGPHRIQLNRLTITIDIPKGEAAVVLKMQLNQYKTLDFVCSPGHIVTVAGRSEPITFKSMFKELKIVTVTGLIFIVSGFVSFIISTMLSINYATLGEVVSMFISSLLLVTSGSVFLIASPKTSRLKLQRIVIGAASALAAGCLIAITVSMVSCFSM